MNLYKWLLMILNSGASSAITLEYTPPPAPPTQYSVFKIFKSDLGRIIVKGKIT